MTDDLVPDLGGGPPEQGASAETWLPIVGFAGYLVSSLGRIRNWSTGRILFGERDKDGYRRVNLLRNGKSVKCRVHRLVCEAFHGPCPDGLDCAHLDGTKTNNAESNLCWATRSENERHKVAHGTHTGSANLRPGQLRGEANPLAKLTTEIVTAIRSRGSSGYSERMISAEFGVSPSQVHKILSREAWSHV